MPRSRSPIDANASSPGEGHDPSTGDLHSAASARSAASLDLRAPAALLARASTELASALELDEALRALAAIVVPAVADWYAVDLVTTDGRLDRVAIHHQDGGLIDQVLELDDRYPRDPQATHGAPNVVRTGQAEFVAEIDGGILEELAQDDEHLRLLRELELSSYVVVPLLARGRTLGAMTFVHAESGRRYDEEALHFLEDLAGRAALTLDNIRLIDELEDARRRVEEQAATLEDQNEELAVQNEELQSQSGELARALNQAEEAHREKEALLASTADGIYGLDHDGRCTFINAAAAGMLGLDVEAARGQNMHELIHHTRRDGTPYPEEECPVVLAFRDGERVRVTDEVLWRADGTSFPAVYSSSPVLRDGEVVGAVVAFADETERRAAEGRAEFLGRILDESQNEIYMFDADTLLFVQVNRGGRDNLGYNIDELCTMTPLDIKPEFTEAEFVDLIEPLRNGDRQTVRFETIHRRRDGSTYPAEVNLQLANGGGRDLFVAVILDITDRRQREEEREVLIAELEEANRVKDEFVSTMSHELRTPLNAVLGYTQLMADGIPVEIPEEAQAHARRIALSGRHLLQLIDEILTFSKLEAGQATADPFPVELPDLVEEVRAVVEPMAADKGLEFRVLLENPPTHYSTDPKKLRQVLLNLTGNAVKFTGEGSVELVIRGTEEGITVRVTDTGIGMSAEEQEKAFEPFWQADQSSTRETGGTGLGLAITRRFVQILGGEIHVDSGAGGTTFTVHLPALAVTPGEQGLYPAPETASGGRGEPR